MNTDFNTRRLPPPLTPDLRARLGAPCKTLPSSHPPRPNIPVCITSRPGRRRPPDRVTPLRVNMVGPRRHAPHVNPLRTDGLKRHAVFSGVAVVFSRFSCCTAEQAAAATEHGGALAVTFRGKKRPGW
ncbi:hypothetical protein EYF80_006311 [Liparis tanakae]|uniref:Uncharacterized protein n=1 Tax=Liparis tanakae TaxID=230148 RepID=A0A4Z2IZC5_9TELE|nr:hypothetical protein EYF80_006311 [Liparis tanakae]